MLLEFLKKQEWLGGGRSEATAIARRPPVSHINRHQQFSENTLLGWVSTRVTTRLPTTEILAFSSYMASEDVRGGHCEEEAAAATERHTTRTTVHHQPDPLSLLKTPQRYRMHCIHIALYIGDF
jgi:hypothetical protein